jgi:hypothetical protein
MNLQKFSPDDVDPAKNHMSGNWGPGFTDKQNSFMLNVFTKYRETEFFGVFETTSGTNLGGAPYDFTQFSLEGLQRFGGQSQFFGGFRYNQVNNDNDMSVSRFQLGGGWFITQNIACKLEYVDQNYNEFAIYGDDAGFKGVMFEAGISF